MICKIVEESSRLKLEKELNRLLDLGWKLQGGVAVVRIGAGEYYSHTVYKE